MNTCDISIVDVGHGNSTILHDKDETIIIETVVDQIRIAHPTRIKIRIRTAITTVGEIIRIGKNGKATNRITTIRIRKILMDNKLDLVVHHLFFRSFIVQ